MTESIEPTGVDTSPASNETVQHLAQPPAKPTKNVHDWLRDLRMSADVNQTTVGVAADRVTPELMLATANKLLGISRRQVEPDPKDSLQFQRVYGPNEYFSEHILRDAGRLGRQLLWKATNKGNLDFMQTAALDGHVSDVFNSSRLSNMIDGSSPLETVDAAFKVTRIGEGGVGDVSSAPDEMRLVQPSFLGYVDSVRSPESMKVGLDTYLTKYCMKGSDGKLYQKFINAHTGKPELVDSVTAAKSVVTTPDMMNAKTNFIYALGGKTGVRIVPKKSVDYYLPKMDQAFSTAANLVTGLSGVKEMRLLMGCLHPLATLMTIGKDNMVSIDYAKDVSSDNWSLPGADKEAMSNCRHRIRATIAKFPPGRAWFRKIVLYSGRALTTSKDHRWAVLRDDKIELVDAVKLKPGDKIFRRMFNDFAGRRTFVLGVQVDAALAALLGYMARGGSLPAKDTVRVPYEQKHRTDIDKALCRLHLRTVTYHGSKTEPVLSIHDKQFADWFAANMGQTPDTRRIPSEILSAKSVIVASFLDAYTADTTKIAQDAQDYTWILSIGNFVERDGIAFLLSRIGTDTYYRDAYQGNGETQLALKLTECTAMHGSLLLDAVKSNLPVQGASIMIDVDADDNLYASASGIITHNSKYPLQAISIEGREAPYVRNIDSETGKDIHSAIGKYLGARFADKPGVVTAVRQNRIDVQYDDGTKGQIALYNNFPMNAKGYITNTPRVKAGDRFGKGGLLASSNYTDDKGVMATGTNLRVGWLSWKGGTYEDAVVLSESAARKLTGSVMYSADLDLDKTVTLGKRNYRSWKPGEYTKEQLSVLNDDGIVMPGTILHKGDPMVLAVRTTEPSPGTMGKRILTDVSQVWEHDNPGKVTDVVRTRGGVKVLATVTTPVEVGDKVSGLYGNKGVCSMILPDDQMPVDKDGKPLDMILSPLGLISRTNPTQLMETLLGKIAHKTGKTELIDAFPENDMHQYVIDKLKQNKLNAEDDFFDPETGRKIQGVVNGYSYIHRLKHLAESKESARGTDAYSTDETPGGSGYAGCFPAAQNIMTAHGERSIATLCEKHIHENVLTWNGKEWCYRPITDWFTYRARTEDILDIFTEYNTSDTGNKLVRHTTCLHPTKNHKMYMADMTVKLAGELKIGDLLASMGPVATADQKRVLLGTLMGDSCFSTDGSLQCEHSYKQVAWCDYKQRALSGLGATLCTGVYKVHDSIINGRVVRGTKARLIRVPRSYMLDELRASIVVNGKRMLTQDTLDKLGELGFCVWYLDDGSMHNHIKEKGKPSPEAVLSTCGFTPDEVALFRPWVEKLLGEPDSTTIAPQMTNDGERHNVRFNRQASWRIAEMVARNIPWQFIPPSKHWLRAWCKEQQSKTPALQHDFISRLGITPVRIVEIRPYKHDKPGVTEIPVYDFTVEDTHKYTLAGYVIVSNSKRFGTLEQSAMAGHAAFDNLLDNKLIRGQSNADFWRSIRTGGIPTIPGEPLVQKKFFAHLQGSGVNVRKTQKGISVFALSNSDVEKLAGPRELKSRDTYEARTFRPIDGGLFGQDVFGQNGDQWGYIQLDEPVPNPVMEEPLARLLRMSVKDFTAAATGEAEVNGIRGPLQLKQALSKIDLDMEAKRAMQEFKDAPASKRDNALKRYVDVENMRRAGLNPSEYMLDRIPVLPAQFRPVTSHNGLTMVADANYLYAQLLDARDDLRDSKDLPVEYQDKARANLYKKWQELTGLYDPEDVKLRNKNVGGLLKWALGTSPKFSAFQRKVLGGSVDTVGRGAIVPNSKLTMDQIGIPIGMAFDIMAPFVERGLVKRGYTPVDAMKMVKQRDKQAADVLNEVIKTHPVEMNRAPTLHKFNIMAFEPVLVQGHAIQVHPSVCPGFNADFDGDTVNVHVPVSDNARKEAMERMRPSRNLIAPSDRKIMYKPEKEYMQGLYFATRLGQPKNGRVQIFRTMDEAQEAYEHDIIDVDTPIRILELEQKQ